MSHGHFAGGILHADFVEEGISERVVELQRNADQKRSQNENREVSVLEETESLRRKNVAEFKSMRGAQWRSMRQCKTINGHQNGRNSRYANWDCRRFNTHVTDDQTSHNPSRGTQHADRAEILLGIFHLTKGERVCERHGRHVAE